MTDEAATTPDPVASEGPRADEHGAPQTLTADRLHALFDILTHHEQYAEVEQLKYPDAISNYGFPFTARGGGSSSSSNSSTSNSSNCVDPLPAGDSDRRGNSTGTNNDDKITDNVTHSHDSPNTTTGKPDRPPAYAADPAAPLLATLLRSSILKHPLVRNLPPAFWNERLQGLLERLAAANLSESYDKGAAGTRKTLATAASAVHEAVARGILGGMPPPSRPPPDKNDSGANPAEAELTAGRDLDGDYDPGSARDLVRAYDDLLRAVVYGDAVRELYDAAARGSPENHSHAARLAVDYIIIHLATFMHYIFVQSAKGPYLLKLLDNVHRLTPYVLIKQTLRLGNAATMISGLMRLLLAKVGFGALSNWVGLTQNADDGMNLLQRIIYLVMSWDTADFRKSADKIAKAKGAPSREHLAALEQFVARPREDHEAARALSVETPTSIVAAIFEHYSFSSSASLSTTPNTPCTANSSSSNNANNANNNNTAPAGASPATPCALPPLTAAQHARCIEYLAALLSARDRDAVTHALCRQQPDLFTQAVRDVFGSTEHLIRAVHDRVDLREHLASLETFLDDLIATSKPTTRRTTTPAAAAATAPASNSRVWSQSLSTPTPAFGRTTPRLKAALRGGWSVRGQAAGGEDGPLQPPSVEDYVCLLRRSRHLLFSLLHQVARQCPEIMDEFSAWSVEAIRSIRQDRRDAGGRLRRDQNAPPSSASPPPHPAAPPPVAVAAAAQPRPSDQGPPDHQPPSQQSPADNDSDEDFLSNATSTPRSLQPHLSGRGRHQHHNHHYKHHHHRRHHSNSHSHHPPTLQPSAAGVMSSNLQVLFAALPPAKRAAVLPALDAHAAYLAALQAASTRSIQRVLDNLAAASSFSSATTAAATDSPGPSSDGAAGAGSAGGGGGGRVLRRLTAGALRRSLSPAGGGGGGGGWGDEEKRQRGAGGREKDREKGDGGVGGGSGGALGDTKERGGGPGIFLARWQDLLDQTLITPATPGGPVRRGRDVGGAGTGGAATGSVGNDDGGRSGGEGGEGEERDEKLDDESDGSDDGEEIPTQQPNVSVVVDALREPFKKLLVDVVKMRWPV